MNTKICKMCNKELPIIEFKSKRLCKSCWGKRKWRIMYKRMIDRCYNPRNRFYFNYNEKGIKVKINPEEFKALFYEQNADKLKHPSIHRIDNKGDYILGNLKFLEWKEHDLLHQKEKENREK